MASPSKIPSAVVDLNPSAATTESSPEIKGTELITKGRLKGNSSSKSVSISKTLKSVDIVVEPAVAEEVPGGDMQGSVGVIEGTDDSESQDATGFVSTVIEPEAEDDFEEPNEKVSEPVPETEVPQPHQDYDSSQEEVPLHILAEMANLVRDMNNPQAEKEDVSIEIVSGEETPIPAPKPKGKRRKTVAPHRRTLPLRSEKRAKISEEMEIPVPEPTSSSVPVKKPKLTKSEKGKEKVSEPSSKSANKKTVLDEFLIDEKFLKDHHLEEIYKCIEEQGWADIFGTDDPVDKNIVAEFYENVSKEERGSFIYLHFQFRGQELIVSSKELAFELDIKHEGFDTFTKKQWPEEITEEQKEEMVKLVCNYYDPNVTDLSTNYMLPTTKILHRLLVSTILPRGSKPALSQIHDILILDQLIRKKQINLPKLIIHQMEYMSQFNQVGHARVVKKILQMHDLYEPTIETSVAKPLTLNNLHRWGIQYNEDQGWIRRSGLEETAKGDGSRTAASLETKETLIKIQKDISELKREVTEIRKRLDEQSADNWIFHQGFEELKSFIKAEIGKLRSRTSS